MNRLTRYIGNRAASAGDMGNLNFVRSVIDRLAAYEDTGLEPGEIPTGLELANVYAVIQELKRYKDSEEQGLLVWLPCKAGSTVWAVTKCENVAVSHDDDYFDGTGAVECPFESSCDIEDCNDNHIRIFETTVTDFWYGDENYNHQRYFWRVSVLASQSQTLAKPYFSHAKPPKPRLRK